MSKFKFWAFKLSGIMILIFILQKLIPGFTNFFVLNSNAFEFWQVWRIFTAIFLHGSLTHLIFNLFSLMLFGSILESIINHKKFLMIFFITGILANIFSVNFYSSSLGASGAIFGVIGALIIIRPSLPVWVFGMPMPLFIAGIIWVSADTLGAVGFFTGNPIDNTGNLAHLSGMFVGFLFGFWQRYNGVGKIEKKKNKELVFNEESIRNLERSFIR